MSMHDLVAVANIFVNLQVYYSLSLMIFQSINQSIIYLYHINGPYQKI